MKEVRLEDKEVLSPEKASSGLAEQSSHIATSNAIRYSICMCNYNMSDTLERSLSSILDQLDTRFEVLIVDDGSSDNSLDVIRSMQCRYPQLRLVELPRDRKRKLGFTRNVSIAKGRGTYVLPQFDCDDVYGPFIQDFIEVFHQIEERLESDFYLKGHKINMGKRDMLLNMGPYRNIFRGEDRDLWNRLAAQNRLILLTHAPLHTRLPKPPRMRFYRALYHAYDHLENDFRSGDSFWRAVKGVFGAHHSMGLKMRALRLMMMPLGWIGAQLRGSLPIVGPKLTGEEMAGYRRRMSGTFPQTMARLSCRPDWSRLTPEGRRIFS